MKRYAFVVRSLRVKQVKQDIVHKNAGLRDIIKHIKSYGISIALKMKIK